MSLHFVIDGYNLIKQTTLLNKINLEDSREALVRFLSIQRPQGRNRVTVIFDGHQGNFYSRSSSCIEVVFSQGQSADDKIKWLVANSKNPKCIVVVTNDREIQRCVSHYHAQVKTIEDFLAKFNTPQAAYTSDEKKPLLPHEAAKITEEMKNIWLR